MSTRAAITIEGVDNVMVYKHCDGYPDGKHGLLGKLQKFSAHFQKERGDDPEYKFAQLLMWLARADDRATRNLRDHMRRRGVEFKYNAATSMTGYGVFPIDHRGCMNEEYMYTLHCDGTVSVEVNHDDD